MESGEEQMQLELDRIVTLGPQIRSFDELMTLTNNSERMMERVNSSLDALNAALDRLEERTDQALVQIQMLIRSGRQLQNPHDGCGDPDARA
ncbi:uncharacterized protein LOC108091697 [Drosophila ficusphila]|uniref:uncharacterized protein LOC108091697 n=1 Tax=Drosophila ficusphila TaxID=30025 RepID=UPI0007E87D28|nr:uncharacterized protein LOC108091697 [Drosophila ficusphila]